MQQFFHEKFPIEDAMWEMSPIYKIPEEETVSKDCDMVCLICGTRTWDPHEKKAWSIHRRYCGQNDENYEQYLKV
jgi:hypothetical protein